MSAMLTCVSSGSIGNSYILSVGGEKLLIELGVPFKETLKAINFDLSVVVGCLVSHRHFDHSMSVLQAQKYGLQCYSNSDVASVYPNVKVIEPMKRLQIGGFKVTSLPTPHGVENYSYIIDNPECGRIAFITDTSEWKYKVSGVNHWFIEANYDEELILDAICSGVDVRSQSEHHLSISKTIDTLKRNYTPFTMGAYLIHLSNGLSNEKAFVERVRNEVGIPCVAVNNGDVFELKSCEF